jgi:hypothetical protein
MPTDQCFVCSRFIRPGADGLIQFEGVSDAKTNMWVWGPVPVHDPCRLVLSTPFDTSIGNGAYLPAWERRTPSGGAA